MIARNKPPVCIELGLSPGPPGRNRRNFVRVLVSYRALLRARAFRPIFKTHPTYALVNACPIHLKTPLPGAKMTGHFTSYKTRPNQELTTRTTQLLSRRVS